MVRKVEKFMIWRQIFIGHDVFFHETIFPFSDHNIGQFEEQRFLRHHEVSVNEACLTIEVIMRKTIMFLGPLRLLK